MSVKKEKVLILSLGTGSKIYDKDGGFQYRKATYQIERDVLIETEFIAEPLMKQFNPDQVIVIGTVKSMWSGLYAKYGDGDADAICQLQEIEENNGIQTNGEVLADIESVINQIYVKGMLRAPWTQMKVDVILTRYGINDEELGDNYRIISKIGNLLNKNREYEIAFDITHSFRSLPLYNLIILNYLKAIAKYKVEIAHVYYGNLEVCRENHNIAPVVDLRELIHVLDMTSGVNEFKNTGNAKTLLEFLPKDDELYLALEQFDWAGQINALDKMEEALGNLMKIVNCPQEEQISQYTDLRSMIREVIRNKFYDGDFENQALGEKQFFISKWYLNQNRYGQAIATALEALRSYLAPMYLRMKKQPDTVENCKKENERKAALDRLRIFNEINDDTSLESRISAMFCRLEESRIGATKVRNRFAHNLDEKVGSIPGDSEQEPKRIIECFISNLSELREYILIYPDVVERVYQREANLPTQVLDFNRPSRIVIANQEDDFTCYEKSNKIKYDVYCLDIGIMSSLKRDLHSRSKNPVENAVFLKRYLEDVCMEQKNISIIFHGLNSRQEMHYMIVLQRLGVSGIYSSNNGKLSTIPLLEYEVDEKQLEEYILPYTMEQMLKKELIKVNTNA